MYKEFYYTACATVVALIAVACSTEDYVDATIDDRNCMMTFTAVREPYSSSALSTRVTDDNMSSSWTDGDKIRINVKSLLTGDLNSTTCTLISDGSIAQYSPQLYWHNTGNHSISAWYSNISDSPTTGKSVDISDQSTGDLPYVLMAKPTVWTFTAKGRKDIPLTFCHQLAKIRVKLLDNSGNGISSENVSLWMRNCYTMCSVDEGVVMPIGRADGYVKMMPPASTDGYFQANIIPDAPGVARQTYAFEVKVGERTTGINLTAPVTFEKGKAYIIEVTLR